MLSPPSQTSLRSPPIVNVGTQPTGVTQLTTRASAIRVKVCFSAQLVALRMTASDAYHSATDTLSALSYTHETMQLHYNGAVRGMVTSSDDSWETFNAAAIARLGNLPAGLLMEFEDPQDNGEVEKVVRLPKKCLTPRYMNG